MEKALHNQHILTNWVLNTSIVIYFDDRCGNPRVRIARARSIQRNNKRVRNAVHTVLKMRKEFGRRNNFFFEVMA